MKIKRVEIQNYKSIKNLEFEFENFLCLIGENSQGKSNILKALEVFFKGEKPSKETLFNGIMQNRMIRLTFNSLNKEEKSFLCEKNWLSEEEDAFHLSLETEINSDKIGTTAYYLYPNNIDEMLDKPLKIGAKLPEELKNILPEIHFVSAVCTVENDVKSDENEKTLFSKIANLIREKYVDSATEEFIKAFKNFQVEIEKETGNKIKSINELQNGLDKFLSKEWGVKTKVKMTMPEVDNIFKKAISLSIDDGIDTPITEKGHGLQRAAIFAMLRCLVELKTENITKPNIFLIEEPELYLHPQKCKETYEMLQKLSNEHQVILCTHSAHFIDLKDFECIYLVKKSTNGTEIKKCEKTFNPSDKEIVKLITQFNPDRNELFFSKKVVLVEGDTEKILFPLVAKKINCFKQNISLVNCGGKEGIPFFIDVLEGFSLNYHIVADKDPGNPASESTTKKIKEHSKNGYIDILAKDTEAIASIYHEGTKLKPLAAYNAYKDATKESIPKELAQLIERIYSINPKEKELEQETSKVNVG